MSEPILPISHLELLFFWRFGDDRAAAFRPGGSLAAELSEWPVACLIGDTLFTHAGLSLSVAFRLDSAVRDAARWLLEVRIKPPLPFSRHSPAILPPFSRHSPAIFPAHTHGITPPFTEHVRFIFLTISLGRDEASSHSGTQARIQVTGLVAGALAPTR